MRNPVTRDMVSNPNRSLKRHQDRRITYHDNMTKEELRLFMEEDTKLEAAYAAADEHDARMQAQTPPDEWEDPSDYTGMGWVGKNGRP